MKKILILAAMTFSLISVAQEKITEGKITSKQSISTDNEQVQAQLDMMGDMQSVTYFKGAISRSEVSSPMTGEVVTIIDNEEKKMLMLMDNPGLGKVYTLESIELSEEDLKNVEVIEGTETKTVLGYECKQYKASVSKDGIKMDVIMYTTEKIDIASKDTATMGDKVKGFPLYMEMKVNQMGIDMTVTTEVTKIEAETVSDDQLDMTPPEGYKNLKG
ncbi:MAG: hypothetical protein Wins2KO_27060 [Winogradskyella sp.]